MGSFSPVHWLIVIVIVLLVFGPGRLAGVGKGLGEGIRQFKKGLDDDNTPERISISSSSIATASWWTARRWPAWSMPTC